MIIRLLKDDTGDIRKKEGYRNSLGREEITSITPPYDEPRKFPRLVVTLDLECDDNPTGLQAAKEVAQRMIATIEELLRSTQQG